jgi:UDP-N-acetylmuramate--alanine ligase
VITPGSGNAAGGTGCGCALTAISGSVCDIIKNHLSSKKEIALLPEKITHIHFIGIGGYGMSALALILLQKGYRVSGSDIGESLLTESLASGGADVKIGHSAGNLGSAQLVVYSTAVPADNPELAVALSRGILTWHRSELLAALLNDSYGIAIAGAHGKTTTTAMAALLLEAGGLDPTAIIGGVLPAYSSNARLGKSRYLVAEADESDSSFTRYYPRLALVTGIEADHLEHYDNDYAGLQQAYNIFLSHLPDDGTAVLCSDDPGLRELGKSLHCPVTYYSFAGSPENEPGYYAANISREVRSSTFDLYHRGKLTAAGVKVGVPGNHNISNAVGALALAGELGLDLPACSVALSSFTGVGRRFDIIGMAGEVTVVDDYAHHPTEVRATLEAARSGAGRIICIFQPHRYTRTATFLEEFSAAFDEADVLLLHSIYPAGEVPIPGATSEALAELIRQRDCVTVFQSNDISVLEEKAVSLALPGDLIFTMGAGDITKSAPRILALLQNS